MKIQEIIVVEGKDDTVAIKRAMNADTIETNGSAVNDAIIEQIRHAQEKRGVIIFTDPDYPGDKIRHTISSQVPGCKHAFLPKQQAIAKSGKGLGVEHASSIDIRSALQEAQQMQAEPVELITFADLHLLGLTAGAGAKEKRERLGVALRIGYANAKQLHHRLMKFGITLEEFQEAVKQL